MDFRDTQEPLVIDFCRLPNGQSPALLTISDVRGVRSGLRHIDPLC